MRTQRSTWSAAVALVLAACASPPAADRSKPGGPEASGDRPAEQVDQAFDAMREENRRRVREIAESSREMEAERQRVIEQIRAREAERARHARDAAR